MYVIVKLAKQQRDMSQRGIYEDFSQIKCIFFASAFPPLRPQTHLL